MALFRDLVRAVAEAEALSEVTVTGIGQYLRDAGLISKFGRGKAAAQMTVQDAVHLLIAVNATDLAKNSAQTVQDFVHLSKSPIIENKQNDIVSRFIAITGNDFGAALGFVLSGLMSVDGARSDFDQMLDETSTAVEVGFALPGASAYIEVFRQGASNPNDPFGGPGHFDRSFAYYRGNKKSWLHYKGKRELRIIDHSVLRAVASILN